MKGPRLDQDPSEPSPPLPGEALFATIVTMITLSGLLFGLRFLFDFSYLTAVAVTAFIVIGSFLIALRNDGKR